MIKSGYDIWTDIGSDTTDLESENHPYNTKWIKVDDVALILDYITEAVDKATFKDGASKIYSNIAYVKEKLFLK